MFIVPNFRINKSKNWFGVVANLFNKLHSEVPFISNKISEIALISWLNCHLFYKLCEFFSVLVDVYFRISFYLYFFHLL